MLHGTDGLSETDLPQEFFDLMSGDNKPFAISDDDFNELPFSLQIHKTVREITRSIIDFVNEHGQEPTQFLCAPIYGDGSSTQLLSYKDEQKQQQFIIAILDVRIVYEVFVHIACTPLARYTPSSALSVAYEKLALCSRISSEANQEYTHLSLGLLSSAQEAIYQIDDSSQIETRLDNLLEQSFLSEHQIVLILSSLVTFLIFHEFAHFGVKEIDFVRDAVQQNLDKFIDVQATNAEHGKFHDETNEKLAKLIMGQDNVDIILDSESSKEEFRRLYTQGFLAKVDKEELLCDNVAVQNTANIMVNRFELGISNWLLVRYAIQTVLNLSWSYPASKKIFSTACTAWNRLANGEQVEGNDDMLHDRILEQLANRRDLILFEKLRERYALDQFDAAMSSVLHSHLAMGMDLPTAIAKFFPSDAMARSMQEFSSRHINIIDRSLYTLEGLGLCSSRGRALQIVSGVNNTSDIQKGDIFSFYVFGKAFHYKSS